jgi:excisionase family DNA binding protein
MARKKQNGKAVGSAGLAAFGMSAWVPVEEAAGLLGVDAAVALEWVEAGRLPAVRVYGGPLHGAVVVRRAALYPLLAPLGWGTG